MIRKIIFGIGGMILSFTLNGCYYDVQEELNPATNTNQCDTSNSTYSNKVVTIIQSNCYSCHSGTSPQGNVNLEGYMNLRSYADNGKLMGVITWAPGFSRMPRGGNKLNDCDITNIQAWITRGTINN